MVNGNKELHASYLRHIRKHDLLQSDEEFILAKKWRETMDEKALYHLVSSHLRLVNKIATGYKGYGLSHAELISEGHVGMMLALKKFDPEKGFRFATYAVWWIKACMQQYILNSWSLVKVASTPQQRRLFFNLRRLKNKLGVADQGEIDPCSKGYIAQELNVSARDIDEMNMRLSQPDHSLNIAVFQGHEGEWQDFIVDEASDHEGAILYKDEIDKRQKILEEALTILNAREAEVLKKRKLTDPPETLEILSQQMGVSKERIRQIEHRSFEKIKSYILLHPQMKQSLNVFFV